jgi:hypothetical protein
MRLGFRRDEKSDAIVSLCWLLWHGDRTSFGTVVVQYFAKGMKLRGKGGLESGFSSDKPSAGKL